MITDVQKAVYSLINTDGIGNIRARKMLSDGEIGRHINNNIDFSALEKKLSENGAEMITILDPEYPKNLSELDDAPVVLFCKGDLSLLNSNCFAVIGTRMPTKYGIRVTEEFVKDLSKRFCIVSGLARGIDACAHRTALDAGGKTIAVLGSGCDVVYPRENYSLYKDICKNGLVISEYDMGTSALAQHFPARNRIISGLSRAVLVTEANEKSGTLITARLAGEQGRDVYAVPGSIYSSQSAGCNKIIKDCQSRSVHSLSDIYDDLGLDLTIAKKSAIQIDFSQAVVINLLSENGEMHFEELLEKTQMTVPALNALLIKCEASKLIMRTKQNFWSV